MHRQDTTPHPQNLSERFKSLFHHFTLLALMLVALCDICCLLFNCRQNCFYVRFCALKAIRLHTFCSSELWTFNDALNIPEKLAVCHLHNIAFASHSISFCFYQCWISRSISTNSMYFSTFLPSPSSIFFTSIAYSTMKVNLIFVWMKLIHSHVSCNECEWM